MAKHAKKNNIISYDEAKQRKLQEQEEMSKSPKHFREERDEYEDFYGNSFDNDAQNHVEENYSDEYADDYANEYNDNDRGNIRQFNEGRRREYGRERTGRSEPKYVQEKAPLPRNMINIIVVALMVLFLAFISIMLYNFYVVETINVVGNDAVKYHDITQLCGVEYKQSMLSVKKEDIVENFEKQQPMIEVVDVKKIWPNVLEITVQERPPICYVVLKGSQKCALIGENNLCLDIQDSYLKGDLPRIFGLDVGESELGKELVDGETRKLEVLKLLTSAMVETDCISELKSININNTTNITMESYSGTFIKMGDTSNLVRKLKTIKVALKRLIMENNAESTLVVTGDNTFYTE